MIVAQLYWKVEHDIEVQVMKLLGLEHHQGSFSDFWQLRLPFGGRYRVGDHRIVRTINTRFLCHCNINNINPN
jgi:hypothetical protein